MVIETLAQQLRSAVLHNDKAEQAECLVLLDTHLLQRGVIVRPNPQGYGFDVFAPDSKGVDRAVPSQTILHMATRIFQYNIQSGRVTSAPKDRGLGHDGTFSPLFPPQV
jgi:hypothetical protein